jgi:hypothetical protein
VAVAQIKTGTLAVLGGTLKILSVVELKDVEARKAIPCRWKERLSLLAPAKTRAAKRCPRPKVFCVCSSFESGTASITGLHYVATAGLGLSIS